VSFLNRSTLNLPATSAFPNGIWQDTRNPTSNDYKNFFIGTIWINFIAKTAWIMVDRTATSGTWIEMAASAVGLMDLTGNSGGPVPPDGSSNINILGTGPLSVQGDPGTNTLTITDSGTLATSYVEDTGSAAPTGGVLNVVGGTGVTTSGAGNTITITAGAEVPTTFVENTGSATPSVNTLNVVGTGSITTSGAGSTITIELTGLTDHSLLVGSGTSTITSLGVATDGQLPIGSTGANPVLATLTAGAGITITNGAGSITIGSTALATFQVNQQVFSTSGTYTPTAGMSYCKIEVLGGGGAGGGTQATNSTSYAAGAGGGAGEYANGIFTAAAIGASKAVTIGAGGIGVSANIGGSGGITSLGTLITAHGGLGGSVGINGSSTNYGIGGNGGTGGTGGSVRTPGAPGIGCIYYFPNNYCFPGLGASSQYGAGGNLPAGELPGNPALGFGSGGSGALALQSDGAMAGGNGSPGVVIITEYIT
jgi:hypothetical protein